MWNRLSLNTPSSGTAVMFRQTGLCSPPTSSRKSKSVYTSTLFIWMYSTEILKSPRHSNEEFILNRVLDDKMVQVNNKTLMYQNFQIKTFCSKTFKCKNHIFCLVKKWGVFRSVKSSPYLESLQSDLASVHFHGDMCTGDPSIHESRAASWQWQLNRGLFSSSNGDSWNLSPENTPKKSISMR